MERSGGFLGERRIHLSPGVWQGCSVALVLDILWKFGQRERATLYFQLLTGGLVFWRLWATLEEEELSWATC